MDWIMPKCLWLSEEQPYRHPVISISWPEQGLYVVHRRLGWCRRGSHTSTCSTEWNYLSHKLSDTQTRWSTVEKEAFAFHFALQKLDYYLHNSRFVIRTDHKPLKYLLEAPIKNKKIQLWALGISGNNCQIEYIPGTQNTCADLLSRTAVSEPSSLSPDEEFEMPDNTLEVNFISSNAISPKNYTKYDVGEVDIPFKPQIKLIGGWDDINIAKEQAKDPEIAQTLRLIQLGQAKKSVGERHLIIDYVLYYLTNAENDPIIRLYVPLHYRSGVIMAITAIWELTQPLMRSGRSIVGPISPSLKQLKPSVRVTDVPPFSFAKIGLDLSGPYTKSLSGNRYIVGFVDFYSGWPESFNVPDKTAATIAHSIIEEIFSRYGAP